MLKDNWPGDDRCARTATLCVLAPVHSEHGAARLAE
jgi:hypothetical protein